MRYYQKQIIKTAGRIFPLKSAIVFESKPDVSGNSKAVFDEMIKRKLNKKYLLAWLLYEGSKDYPPYENVDYIDMTDDSQAGKILDLKNRSRCLISENKCLATFRDDQNSFYLSHGAPIKSTRAYYTVPEKVNYSISLCEGMNKSLSYELDIPLEKLYALGYPRNDVLTSYRRLDLNKMFHHDAEKYIIWYPTYRQNRNMDSSNTMSPIPILHNDRDVEELNQFLKETRTMLIIKPHFQQDLDIINLLGHSNIIFIDNGIFDQHYCTSYELVASCDALITDYSSIYYDYLICDKPVAPIWEDIDLYRDSFGLTEDYEKFCSGAQILYNMDEFKEFVLDVNSGTDRMKEKRHELVDSLKLYTDGKSAERVVDFIIEKASL